MLHSLSCLTCKYVKKNKVKPSLSQCNKYGFIRIHNGKVELIQHLCENARKNNNLCGPSAQSYEPVHIIQIKKE